jgi:hypothetical protein
LNRSSKIPKLGRRNRIPDRERSKPEQLEVFSAQRVPVQIESVVNSPMALQKSLCMFDRFETSHASFSNPSWLVGEFSSIVGVLLSAVIGFGNQRSLGGAHAAPARVGA